VRCTTPSTRAGWHRTDSFCMDLLYTALAHISTVPGQRTFDLSILPAVSSARKLSESPATTMASYPGLFSLGGVRCWRLARACPGHPGACRGALADLASAAAPGSARDRSASSPRPGRDGSGPSSAACTPATFFRRDVRDRCTCEVRSHPAGGVRVVGHYFTLGRPQKLHEGPLSPSSACLYQADQDRLHSDSDALLTAPRSP